MRPRATWSDALEASELSPRLDVPTVLGALRSRDGLVALDSAGGAPRRWSLVAFEPWRRLAAERLDVAELRAALRGGPASGAVPGPFRAGFLGSLAYGLGVAGEALDLGSDPLGMPGLVGGLYERFVLFDHELERVHLVTERGCATRGELERELAEALAPRPRARASELTRLVPRDRHTERIERARELIAAGEIYQANLAHPFEARTVGDPLELYLALREENPAPYMAFLRRGPHALLSSSPELLLEVRGRAARTRPIKGTARRSADPERDRQAAHELLRSAKDRAELAMIVDLERNDLGRVARAGSVRVGTFPELESYAGVHHLVADVRCELDEDRDALDALASLFPGGSITGAPKLRAMEAIAALEGEGRGHFTGSLGFVSCDGAATFNILIRTLQWRAEPAGEEGAGRVRYWVGGGITWDSDAAAEDDETLAKGARLAAALGRAPAEARA